MTVQVAEFSYPFPAEIFKEELTKAGIIFVEEKLFSSESGTEVSVFKVADKDVERASYFRDKVDKEDAISKEKHRHPALRFVQWFCLVVVVVFMLYKFISDLTE